MSAAVETEAQTIARLIASINAILALPHSAAKQEALTSALLGVLTGTVSDNVKRQVIFTFSGTVSGMLHP